MSKQEKLQPHLDEANAKVMAKLSPEAQEVFTRAAKELAASDVLSGTLKAGDTAPNFTLPNTDGTNISLADLLATGAVVLTFYRGVWCPFCIIECKSLQSILPDIKAAGGHLVAISPTTLDHSRAMVEKGNLTYDVLSDSGNKVARHYGLVYHIDESLGPIYVSYGIDLHDINGDDSDMLPISATYIINQAGIITTAFLDTDYTKRMEPAAIIAALKECKE